MKQNLLLTERDGRTGEYWLCVVSVRTERSGALRKLQRANIALCGSSKLGQYVVYYIALCVL